MTERGAVKIKEIILTVAGVWLFTAGTFSERALAQNRGLSEAAQTRIESVEKDHVELRLEMERRTIPIMEQMKAIQEDVRSLKDGITWTNRAIIGVVGGFLLTQLLTMLFNYKKSTDKER